MLWWLCLQSSLLVAPLYLGDAPPECRAARAIVIAPTGVPDHKPTDDDRARAKEVRARLATGARFEDLVARYSSGPTRESEGVMGTFMQGLLAPPIDQFLFHADVGATSDVLETVEGLLIVQRIEKDAACAMIEIAASRTDAAQRAQAVAAKLAAGAEFDALAREYSDDHASAARGGAYKIFERGPNDLLIKKAAFELPIGAISKPIESPLGWHILRRLPLDSVDAALAETNLIRARAIVVAHTGSRGAAKELRRSSDEALELAKDLARRAANGESFAELARYYDDEPTGRERAGDLGWLRRRSPQVPTLLDPIFLQPIGATLGPLSSTAGWVLVQRTR